jgi:hypothetical protein
VIVPGTLAMALVLTAALFQAPSPAATPVTPTPEAAFQALENAWKNKDRAGYLALWSFKDAASQEEEADLAASRLSEGTSQITLQRARKLPDGSVKVDAQIFSSVEPRARVEQVTLTLRNQGGNWRITDRAAIGQLDGLVHLSLDRQPFRADGLKIQLEDFELTMTRGFLFLTPQNVGPTAAVFVGDGQVRVRPRPEHERAQLVQYHGRPELVERVNSFFLRLHPGDLHRVLVPVRLTPDSAGAARYAAAERLYREQVVGSYLLDTPLPGSPWWLLPSLGDALITFQSSRGLLTYTVSSHDPEGISFFDRTRHRQILLYPVEGMTTDYDEDEGRSLDVVRHDLSVRFSPLEAFLEGENTIRLRLLTGNPSLRLRLHSSLKVSSVRSAEGGEHLFFRVRNQDSIVVSLGPLAGRSGEVSLTVRFAGTHRPDEVQHELMQVRDTTAGVDLSEPEIVIDEVLVYSNKTAWYPQGGTDDHAVMRARFDVPASYMALTGGTRTRLDLEGGRRILEFTQDVPGKYITAVVGRLQEVARLEAAGVPLVGYSVARARSAVQETLAETARILSFLTEEFGPMPFPSLNVVVAEGRAPGGHSPPGMIVLFRRPPMLRQPLRDDPASFHDLPGFFLAHELAHQWWGHGVAGKNYRERWVAEAFAQYAAALWMRKSRGEETFRVVMARMARWALRHTDMGPIHLGYRLGHLKEDPQIFRAVVYDKGAYVLHMLRGVVGEEAFRRGLASLQKDHRLGKAGTEDVRRALEKASGLDLRPYFESWVYGTTLPALTVSQRTEAGQGGFRTVVDIAARDLPGPVPLEITVGQPRRPVVKVVSLPREGGRFVLETPSRPGRLSFNDDRGLLARIERKK